MTPLAAVARPPSIVSGRIVADLPLPLQGDLEGRYRIERELGRGGMATVYLARDLRHDRPVALKVLHQELAHALGPERFVREIRSPPASSIPTSCRSSIAGRERPGSAVESLWYSMPYVAGESLRRATRPRAASSRCETPSGSRSRSPMPWATPTGRASSTVTSSRRTSCSPAVRRVVADFGVARALDAGRRRAADRDRHRVRHPGVHEPGAGEPATGGSMAGATSMPWAASSTRCWPASRRSPVARRRRSSPAA